MLVPMKESNKLFELIQLMSIPEKVYFKKYTSIHTKGHAQNYISLFDAMAAQKKYDEQKLKKVLKGNPVLKYLSISQGYLYKTILKSLRAYNSNESNTVGLIGLLFDAAILNNKGLFEQSNRILEQAKEKTIEMEDITSRIYIYKRIYQNYNQQSNLKQCLWMKEQFHPKVIDLADDIKELAQIENLFNSSNILYCSYGGNASDPEVIRQAERILNDPLLKPGIKYRSLEAQYDVYSLKYIIYAILGDYSSCYTNANSQLAIVESDPLFFKNKNSQKIFYIRVLCNKLIACGELGKIAELEEVFKKLQEIKADSLKQEMELFSGSYINITGGYILNNMAEKGLALIPELSKKLQQYADQLPIRAVHCLQSNIATICFLTGDYQQALKWINWRSLPKEGQLDLNTEIKILSMLVHYELGNFQLVESISYSLRRQLSKLNSLDDFLKIVFHHMKQLAFINEKKEVREKLLLFKNELGEVQKKTDSHSIIQAWLETKLRNN